MSSSTPGPWTADIHEREVRVSHADPDRYGEVVVLPLGEDEQDRERSIADADLIAAAPDLLQVVQEIVQILGYEGTLKDSDSGLSHDDVQEIRDEVLGSWERIAEIAPGALAKARGE